MTAVWFALALVLAPRAAPALPPPVVGAVSPVTNPVCGEAEMLIDLLPVLSHNIPAPVLALLFGPPFQVCALITTVPPPSATATTSIPRAAPSPVPPTALPETAPAPEPPAAVESPPAAPPTPPSATPPVSSGVPVSAAAPALAARPAVALIRGGQYGLVWAVPLALLGLGWLLVSVATRDLTSSKKGTP